PVDRGQQLAGRGALALLLPQAAEAHGGPQLQRFRLLAAGHGEGLLEARCRLYRLRVAGWRLQRRSPPDARLQQQPAFAPPQFGLPVTLTRVFHTRQRLVQDLYALLDLPGLPAALGQQAEKPRL